VTVLLQISWKMLYSEGILKICQYLTKLCVDYVGLLFLAHPVDAVTKRQFPVYLVDVEEDPDAGKNFGSEQRKQHNEELQQIRHRVTVTKLTVAY